MGYDVQYIGELTIEPPLNEAERRALTAFFNSRRIQSKAGPLDTRDLQRGHADLIDHNTPPAGQPGLWCNMQVSEDGARWGQDKMREKAGDLTPWVVYVIDHLLKPEAEFSSFGDEVPETDPLRSFTFDHVVNGEMRAVGSDGDVWTIYVADNVVRSVEIGGDE